MRPIKFRAWDTQNECWLESTDVLLMPDGTIEVYDAPSETWMEGGPIILQFFTGLLDAKGEEIYEGDIVQSELIIRIGTSVQGKGRNQRTYAQNIQKQTYGKIAYKEGVWLVEYQEYDAYPSYFWGSPQGINSRIIHKLHEKHGEVVVVGNIYEHPELLEEVSE